MYDKSGFTQMLNISFQRSKQKQKQNEFRQREEIEMKRLSQVLVRIVYTYNCLSEF